MTRYSIGSKEIHKFGGHYGEEAYTICDISIEPHPEGNWVKWKDIALLLDSMAERWNGGGYVADDCVAELKEILR